MNGNMLFHEWFVLITGLLGMFTGYSIFVLRRLDVAFWTFVCWFFLAVLEVLLQDYEFKKWKRRVFQ
jgi:hypothetical protein